jgi:isopenicillin N synthase-like dioxygenase
MAVPVLDVGEFADDGWYPALDRACAEWGCFQIVRHGIDASLIAATVRQMQQFFALPREDKLAIERTRDNVWGFFDRELTKNVRDWKEIFDFGPVARHGPLAGSVPQWPTDLAEFQTVMEAFYEAAERVAAAILAGISSNLGMAPDHLGAGFGAGHTSFLRLNYSPLCEVPDEHLGISHHTDAGALTVLLADDQPGLQFLHEGEWHTVAPNPEALTINIGDIVQVWSNDRYAAPLHRVLASADAERFSAPFFYNPDYRVDYAPLPSVVSEKAPARYRPINWGEFRTGRAAGDYANQGEEIQISHYRC